MMLLEIKNLKVQIENKEILKGINLTIQPGEIHAIMGPNGSGKSTLANVLSGREGYEIESGTIHFGGQDLLILSPEERARAGLFLAFQYPIEIPGVSNIYFLKAAVNEMRKAKGQPEYDAMDFTQAVKQKMKDLQMPESLLYRSINEGFSGGEKKRNEVLQMLMLEPTLAMLDETDSGLDIDALKIISEGVNSLRAEHRSFLMITHYQRLLDHIKPDVVHILAGGLIRQSGGPELAATLEAKGYEAIKSSDKH